ncbi:MAG: ASKHA domain-containing protein, partial [Anaerolineales bacterium]
KVTLPPLIGGFVGSDALACLAEFGYDDPSGPMVAIDLGTNGEVLVTDGEQILCASTAAGPAFEGVNISCGSRAVDGAVVDTKFVDGSLDLKTINDEPPIGLTGSGLLATVYELVKLGLIEKNGRINQNPEIMKERIGRDEEGIPFIRLMEDNSLTLTQWDIRELQKAKGAIRAAVDTLMQELAFKPDDLDKILLTGSFGGQVDITATMQIGMIPKVSLDKVETVANGAGLGAAKFLTEDGFELGERLAKKAKQIDLDQNPNFVMTYVESMNFPDYDSE